MMLGTMPIPILPYLVVTKIDAVSYKNQAIKQLALMDHGMLPDNL